MNRYKKVLYMGILLLVLGGCGYAKVAGVVVAHTGEYVQAQDDTRTGSQVQTQDDTRTGSQVQAQDDIRVGSQVQKQDDTWTGSQVQAQIQTSAPFGNGATSEAAKGPEGTSAAVTFTDALGREVTVTSHDRVATLIGSFTDIWLLAGGNVVAAANDSWESLGLELDEATVNLGTILAPDVEQLIAAQPDLVIASANTDADVELEELLTQAGITVVYFAVSDFQDYLHMLDVCTDITGRKDLYEQNGLAVERQIEAVLERVDKRAPKVLFLRAASSSVKAKGSKGNVCGEMLAALGCVNIADSDNGLLDDLSMEAIIAEDPEYIFVTVQGSDVDAAMRNVEELLISNPAWGSLTAVKNGNYYVLDKRLFNLKPNARWGEAYEILANILYPER